MKDNYFKLHPEKSSRYIDGRCSDKYFCLKCNKKITYQSALYGSHKCRSCYQIGTKKSNIFSKNLSKRMKILWKTKEYRDKMLLIRKKQMTKDVISKIINKLQKRNITCFEKRIIKIIKDYNLNYRFVGDGTYIISGLNPDFISNDNKKIIEVYYSFFKKKQYGTELNYQKKRYAIFRRNGYKTLFLNETMLRIHSDEYLAKVITNFS